MTPDAPGNARPYSEGELLVLRGVRTAPADRQGERDRWFATLYAARAPSASGETGGAVAWAVRGENGGLCCFTGFLRCAEEDARLLDSVVIPLYAAASATTGEGDTPATGPTVEEVARTVDDAMASYAKKDGTLCRNIALAVLDLFKKGGS